MTVNVPSFFAGIGTVLVLLMLGFGGGVVMSGLIADKPREPGKVEKWAAEAQKAPSDPQKPQVVTATPVPVLPPTSAAQQPVASTEPPPEPTSVQLAPQPQQSADTAPVTPTPSVQPTAQPQPAPLRERPVALTNPAQPNAASDEQVRLRKAKREADKRKAEQRKQMAERQRRHELENSEQARVVEQRPRRQEIDDDDDDDRAPSPLFHGREREDFKPRPFFRLFGDND